MPRLEEQSRPAQQRISLPLTEDGTAVDWEHVRPSTASKFEGLLRTDENIRKAFQEENASEEPIDFGLSEQNVRKLLDTVTSINASIFQIVAAKWIKHPLPFMKDPNTGKPLPFVIEPDLLKMMKFNDEQHAELDPRATRIAKKYENKMPRWLRENFDLYVFGSMFITYTAENAKAVMVAQVERDLARAREAQARMQQHGRPQPVNGADRTPPPPPSEPRITEEPEGL